MNKEAQDYNNVADYFQAKMAFQRPLTLLTSIGVQDTIGGVNAVIAIAGSRGNSGILRKLWGGGVYIQSQSDGVHASVAILGYYPSSADSEGWRRPSTISL